MTSGSSYEKDIMKVRTVTLFYIAFFCIFSVFISADTLTSEMQRLQPFVGKWKTRSVYPDSGLTAPGVLEYRWILGGKWLFIEFIGKHPKRKHWGAYSFIRHDKDRKCYLCYDIYDETAPILSTGYWIDKQTIRFEDRNAKIHWGIDYTIRRDGSIYQENWVMREGKRSITLKTTYKRLPTKQSGRK